METTETTTEQINPSPLVEQTASELESIDLTKWSWGGFLNPWYAVIASRRYSYLPLFILYVIPLVNILSIAIHIYFGMKGRQFIKDHNNAFTNDSEVAGFIRGYDHVGWISFLIGLAIFALIVILMLFSFTGMFGEFSNL